MAVNFKELLDTNIEDAKRPPTLPAGTYHGSIKGYEFKESKQKKTPYVQYAIQLLEAGDDVDAEALAEIDLGKKVVTHDFYLTEDSKYRLREFLEALGVAKPGHKFSQLVPEAVGEAVLVEIYHEPNKDDITAPPYARVRGVTADKA